MTIFKGLKFFKQMHSNGTLIRQWVLASYHHPESITWRWVIRFSPRKSGKTGCYFMRVYQDKGFNFHTGINLPIFGSITIQTQPHMWRKTGNYNENF